MPEDPKDSVTRAPATPWWVKAIGLAILVIVILLAAIFIISGGEHGPGRHGALALTLMAAPVSRASLGRRGWRR